MTDLSNRELEVLRWISEGKTNWEISKILCISERTVKFHVQNTLCKLGTTRRGQAVGVAMSLGLMGRTPKEVDVSEGKGLPASSQT